MERSESSVCLTWCQGRTQARFTGVSRRPSGSHRLTLRSRWFPLPLYICVCVCVSDESTVFGDIKLASHRESGVDNSGLCPVRWGGEGSQLIYWLSCVIAGRKAWPNLLSATLDATFSPRSCRCRNRVRRMSVMNDGKWNKSDRSAEQFALNLPPRLAHLNSAGSLALRGS